MLQIIDPQVNYPHDHDFSDVHYFHAPGWNIKQGQMLWLIWSDGQRELTKYGLFLDEESGYEVEKPYTETKTVVKGMIELQVNPYNADQVWLTFFEVTPNYKGQGFSRVMIKELIKALKQKFPSKTLSRSRPSDEGRDKLFKNLTQALDEANISWKSSSLEL